MPASFPDKPTADSGHGDPGCSSPDGVGVLPSRACGSVEGPYHLDIMLFLSCSQP